MTRRLWLVRHGETAGQSSIRYHGSNDVPLSDHGRAQIQALVPWLAGADFARIVHSPLVRAVESAAILAAGLRFPGPLACDERLREISFGACEGMTREEIDAAYPGFWDDLRANRVDAFPGGESRSAYGERVAAAARELLAASWQGDLLVVSHRGTVRHLLRTALGFEASAEDPFAVELGSLTVVRDDGIGFRLELLGALP